MFGYGGEFSKRHAEVKCTYWQ